MPTEIDNWYSKRFVERMEVLGEPHKDWDGEPFPVGDFHRLTEPSNSFERYDKILHYLALENGWWLEHNHRYFYNYKAEIYIFL